MKKILSFAVCFALTVLIALSFAGCKVDKNDKKEATASKKTETPTIIGSWTADVDISGSLKSTLDIVNASMAQYMDFSKATASVTFTFSEDETYTVTINNKNELQNKFTELEKAIPDGLRKYLAKIIEAHGLNTTPEDMCLEQDGMTLEQEAEDFAKKWDLSRFLEDGKGIYRLDGNTLFLGTETNIIEDRFSTVELGADTLKVKYYSKNAFGVYYLNDILPITLKKEK